MRTHDQDYDCFSFTGTDELFNGIDFSASISRSEFEQLNAPLFHKALDLVQRVLQDTNVSKRQVDEIVLVGGSTRIPKSARTAARVFRWEGAVPRNQS